MKRPGKICFGAAALGIVALAATAYGQLFEDTMEPDEMGIRDVDSLVTPSAAYVGNEVCKTCHPASYRKWLETEHSRAFVPMLSMVSRTVAERAGVTAGSPSKSGKCLRCHATAHDVPADYRGPLFRMGEGVSCEKCHGPGGGHVDAVEAGGADPGQRIRLPREEDCMGCHSPKPSHEGIEGRRTYSVGEARKRIAHMEGRTN